MIKVRFTNVGPNKFSWEAELDEWVGEDLTREIKRQRFCESCGANYRGRVECECGAELSDVWPYRTPPDLWYDNSKGKVWLGGAQLQGTFRRI